METAGPLIIIFILLVAGYGYFNNRGTVPVDETPLFTSLYPFCSVDISSDARGDFLVYLTTDHRNTIFAPVTGIISIVESNPFQGDTFKIITSSGFVVYIELVYLLDFIGNSTAVDAGQRIGVAINNQPILRVYRNEIPQTLHLAPNHLLPLFNINNMDTSNAAGQAPQPAIVEPGNTDNPGGVDHANAADKQETETDIEEMPSDVPAAPVKHLQFTAKAAGDNLDFGKAVKDEIAFRIEKGYSSSEQEAIFQMFNFAINYQRNWKFTTSGKQPQVFYNNKKQ
jgi:hypothetical protein